MEELHPILSLGAGGITKTMEGGKLVRLSNPKYPQEYIRDIDRKEAFAKLSLREYREEMSGIYTTCVSRDTLDESPMAYKGIEEIISQIGPTVDIVEQIRPVYNFKASE